MIKRKNAQSKGKVFYQWMMKIIFLALMPSFAFAEGKLAIVIDDIGYRVKEDRAIFAMPVEIAVAILPTAPYAKQRNLQAYQQQRDILIHLPMQPLGQHAIEEGGLTLGLNQEEVLARVKQAKQIVSYAIGVNNHMGSAATTDYHLMNYLMQALLDQHLFFLDSRTIGRSLAGKVAKELGVKSLDRHIFLDDSDAYDDVQRQFQQALNYARKHGKAVVIGHPRKNTIAVLQQGLANLPSDVQLVRISSLWRDVQVVPAKPFIYFFSGQPAPTSVAPFENIPLLRGVPR